MLRSYNFYISLYFFTGAICMAIGMFGYDFVAMFPSPIKESIRTKLEITRIANPFEENDIIDTEKLIEAVATGNQYLSELIRAKLSKAALELIVDAKLSDAPSRREHLVVELNRIARAGVLLEIGAFSIYDVGDVNVMQLQNPADLSEGAKIILTRRLLVAAFPGLVRNGYFYRWDYWNLAAVLLTFSFSILFWFDCYFDNGRPPIFREMNLGAHAIINLLFAVALAFLWFAFNSTLYHDIEGKLIYTALFFLCWLIIDIVIIFAHRQQAIKDEFWNIFCYIDLTFLVTIAAIILFYYMNRHELIARADFPTFLTGAFAFKVILQNTNFLVVIIRSQR